MRFPLTPHVKNILKGRSFFTKDGRLLCAANEQCLHYVKDQPDPDYGRDIQIKGHGVCPRCGKKTDWSERVFNERMDKYVLKCNVCAMKLIRKDMVWTQEVESRHNGENHEYHHGECWDAKFINIPDDDDEKEEKED